MKLLKHEIDIGKSKKETFQEYVVVGRIYPSLLLLIGQVKRSLDQLCLQVQPLQGKQWRTNGDIAHNFLKEASRRLHEEILTLQIGK